MSLRASSCELFTPWPQAVSCGFWDFFQFIKWPHIHRILVTTPTQENQILHPGKIPFHKPTRQWCKGWFARPKKFCTNCQTAFSRRLTGTLMLLPFVFTQTWEGKFPPSMASDLLFTAVNIVLCGGGGVMVRPGLGYRTDNEQEETSLMAFECTETLWWDHEAHSLAVLQDQHDRKALQKVIKTAQNITGAH